VEKNELDQITNYINNGPNPSEKILEVMDLKSALGIKVNVFNSLVQR